MVEESPKEYINLGFGPAKTDRHRYHPIELFRRAGQWVLNRDSELAYEVIKDPGSWRTMEAIYRDKHGSKANGFPGISDLIFMTSPACKSTRNRKQVAGEELLKLLKKYEGDKFEILSLGSGPAHDIIDALYNHDGGYPVTATCVDIDLSSLEYGKKLAEEKGVHEKINFLHGDVRELGKEHKERYDAVSIIGLMEYLDHENSVKFLKYTGDLLKEDGALIASNMKRHWLIPIMDFFGRWVLSYKRKEELEEIVRKSGYSIENSFYEPKGVHSFVIARKNNSKTS